ncbi:MAG TPA: cupin domain-containing protein [Acidimicrobiia bacterium]|nr:cupin domain-containing protein [Acidimicrobiia bacterium]
MAESAEPLDSTSNGAPIAPFDLERDTLHAVIGEHPVAFRHGFGDDARCTLETLGPYTARLPSAWIRAHWAQYSPHEPRGVDTVPADADLDTIVRDLATSNASIRVYNLELTSEFREVAAAVDGPVRALVGDDEGGVESLNLGVFLASPDAVTPAHPDRHHNLLLGVSGTKEVWVEDDPDERAHYLRVLDWMGHPQDGAPVLPPARRFVLRPGDGVYIPPYAFHWTTVLDDGPAVGLSIGFSTPDTVRSAVVHDWDCRMRSKGMRPRPSPAGGTRERAKTRCAAALVHVARARDRLTGKGDRATVPAGQEGDNAG